MSVSRRTFLQTTTIVSATLATTGAASVPPAANAQQEPEISWSNRGRRVMQLAAQQTACFETEYVGSEHLLLALAAEAEESGTRWLDDLGLCYDDLLCVAQHIIPGGNAAVGSGALPYSDNMISIIESAARIALKLENSSVQPEHLMLALVDTFNTKAVEVLEQMWLERGAFRQVAFASLAA